MAKAVQIEELPPRITITSTSSIQSRIEAYSVSKGVSPKLALYIAKRESGFDPKQIGDMKITCKRTGKPVRARGLYQITQCFHPEISDAQAFDPDFAMKWAIGMMVNKKDCLREFSTCKDYYNL